MNHMTGGFMKKNLFRLIAVCGLAAATAPLFAQSVQGFKAVVPFDFQVGVKTLPAGVYVIEPVARTLHIRNINGSADVLQLTGSTEKKSLSGGAELVFYSYDGTAVLDRVIPPGTQIGFQLPKTKLQKELAARLPHIEISATLSSRH